MNGDGTPQGTQIGYTAERVLDADPAQVWALVADPMRVGEWAPLEVVGYLGTELPKTGQIVFLRTKRWRPRSRSRRVEVKVWEAGSRYRGEVRPDKGGNVVQFEVGIKPEATGEGIATRIRLTQGMEAPSAPAALVRLYVSRQLERRLDCIEKIVVS